MTRNQTPLLSSQGAVLIPALSIIPACSLSTLAEGRSYNQRGWRVSIVCARFFSGVAERQTPTSGILCRECQPWAHGYGRPPGPFPYPVKHPGVITSVSAVPSHTHVLQKCLLQGQRASLRGPSVTHISLLRQRFTAYKPGKLRQERNNSWHMQGLHWGFLACNFRLKLLLYKPYWVHFLLQACAVLGRASLLKSGITRKWLLHAQGSEAEESAITWDLHH